MTEKQNSLNISTLKTNTNEKNGILSIANGVKDNYKGNEIAQLHSAKPNEYTKTIRSTIESLLNCKINERVNNQYIFFRWEMPHISDVGNQYIQRESSIIALMQNAMTVAMDVLIALQTLIPLGLMLIPFIENINKFQNPFRRPIAMSLFLFGTLITIYLGIGAALPIDKSLTLGLF